MIDDPAAKHRADRSRDGRKSRPGADRLAALGRIERGPDDGERAWHQQRSSDALDHAGGNQLRNTGSKSTPDRRSGENAQADHEHEAPAEPVADRAANQQ